MKLDTFKKIIKELDIANQFVLVSGKEPMAHAILLNSGWASVWHL